jgi:hypothetical protein
VFGRRKVSVVLINFKGSVLQCISFPICYYAKSHFVDCHSTKAHPFNATVTNILAAPTNFRPVKQSYPNYSDDQLCKKIVQPNKNLIRLEFHEAWSK